MFDIWDEDNPLVREQRSRDNYVIRDYKGKGASPVCVIYFSSNGLYYPNTEESFRNFMEKDRFEWMHHHVRRARREIYVRDIFKQWYIAGINDSIDSIGGLVEWLRGQVPDGCRVVTVGNSSGGYMAVLAGCLLGACRVYDFSGQFDISDILYGDSGKNALFRRRVAGGEAADASMLGYLYLDLVPLIKTSDATNIYYFYPAGCQDDLRQAELVADVENVYSFAFKGNTHGQTMYNYNLDDVLNMKQGRLSALARKYRGRQLGRLGFSVAVCGLWRTLLHMLKKMGNKN